MDFVAFHRLHELLKHGISEYIQNDQPTRAMEGTVFIITMVKLQQRFVWHVHYNFLLVGLI